MSLSKEKLTVAAVDQPRQPKCTRCRHHGIIVPQKGHIKVCPFLKCDCWKCFLITERTRITALQRNLKKAQNKPQNKEKRPCAHTGDSVRRPAAQGACTASAQAGGASASATSQLSGVPQNSTRRPLDPRCGPVAGGDLVAGSESRNVLPFPSSEERCNVTPLSAPYFGELGLPAPFLPFIHFPFRMSGPSSYAPCPNFMLNMPWLPPVPAGLYDHGLHGPLMFPYFQQGAVHYPPPPEPGPPADCKHVFFTLQTPPLPEAFQEELISKQHPQPLLVKHNEPDILELD